MNTTTEPSDEIGGYDLASRLTGLNRKQLYHLVREQRIPHIRISARTVRFRRNDVVRWLSENTIYRGFAPLSDASAPQRGMPC